MQYLPIQRSVLSRSRVPAGMLLILALAGGARAQSTPAATLTGPTELTVGETGSWSFGALDADGDLARWRFYKDDNPQPQWSPISGGQVEGVFPGQGATFSFDKPGFYSWIVEVEDSTGLRSWTHLNVRVSLRVNAGRSTSYTSGGVLWLPDQGFNTGSTATVSTTVSNTTTPELFKTERYEPSTSPPLTYAFPVHDDTTYLVRLLLAETHTPSQAVGNRIFHVDLEAVRAFSNIDIFQMSGGANRAMVLEKSLTVPDGTLTIGFVRQVQNPKVNAIEVIPITRRPIRINAGETAASYQDAGGDVWSTDRLYSTGETSSVASSTTNSGTSDPALYRVERFDRDPLPQLRYRLPAPNGSYQVRLHFAETFSNTSGNGLRVFDVDVEGLRAFEDVDIYRQAGGARKALVLETTAQVSDGVLDIAFSHQVQNPKVNAIEVLAISPAAADSQAPTQPGPLTFSNVTGSTATVNWTAATDNIGVTSYRVSRGGVHRATVTGLSFADSGLSAATSYNYSVVALDAAGNESVARTGSVTTAPPASSGTTIRINAGGPAYVDSLGNSWSADTGYNTGTASNTAKSIGNTPDPTLYHSMRYDGASAPELRYQFNVANGSYRVRLHFTENYAPNMAVGKRVFDVNVQSVRAFENVDIFELAGAGDTALILETTASVTGGQLVIDFLHQVENPKINAIEILPAAADTQSPTQPGTLTFSNVTATGVTVSWAASTDNVGVIYYNLLRDGLGVRISATSYADSDLAPNTSYTYYVDAEDAAGNVSPTRSGNVSTLAPPSSTTIRVNAGGPAYVDSSGIPWSADTGYNTGIASTNAVAVSNTSDPTLYHSNRYDDPASPELRYAFAVPNGAYQVRLHFAEITSGLQGVGKRVFDINVEGMRAFEDLDIYAEVGGYRALILETTASVADGQLAIDFFHQVQNPKINAIEILPAGGGPLNAPSASPATNTAATSFTANWSAVAGATSYRLDMSTSSSFGTFLTSYQNRDVGNATSFAVTGLTANTTYYYRVRAVNGSGTSPNSNTVSATTSASNPNGDDDGDGILNGVEQQLGTAGNSTTSDTGNSTQLKVHKP